MLRIAGWFALLLALSAATGCAATGERRAGSTQDATTSDEADATARYFMAVRDHPALLAAFLREFPKGGDLHSHLSGAVYAERLLAIAAEDGVCIDVERLQAIAGPCEGQGSVIPAAQAIADSELHGRLVDAWSVRNWHPAMGPGHARFFGAFSRFRGALSDHRAGDLLADVTARAADGRVAYLELMFSPDPAGARRIAQAVAWQDDMQALHTQVRAAGLDAWVDRSIVRVDEALARQRQLLGCDAAGPPAACEVVVRFQFAVGRARSPGEVFANLALGFALASRDPRFVAINLVQPEDHPRALQDYALHMAMVGFLSRRHPEVGITLHAGELTPGLVPPEHLRSHIRQAIDIAGAQRIGHAVSVMHEDDPHALLRHMADRKVLVEVALGSNDVILGVRGDTHPLPILLEHGVPVALVTDDEGVARSSLPQEFERAVQDHRLDYAQLKQLARNSLEHAFIEGPGLWQDAPGLRPITACDDTSGGLMSASCDAAVAGSSRAGLQRRLEVQFRQFERVQSALPLPGAFQRGGRVAH